MRFMLLTNLFHLIYIVIRRGRREEFKEDWVNGMGNEQKDDGELS